MPEIRGIEELLNDARELLHEAGPNVVGPWRDRVDAWSADSAEWLRGFKRHPGTPESEVSRLDAPVDPVEKRLSNLERDLSSVTQAVMLLQTLAMAQGMRQSMEGQGPSKWQVAQDLDPDAEVELVDGSKVKIKDVPLGEDGQPEEEWAMKNCPCDTHKARRAGRDAGREDAAADRTGLYL